MPKIKTTLWIIGGIIGLLVILSIISAIVGEVPNEKAKIEKSREIEKGQIKVVEQPTYPIVDKSPPSKDLKLEIDEIPSLVNKPITITGKVVGGEIKENLFVYLEGTGWKKIHRKVEKDGTFKIDNVLLEIGENKLNFKLADEADNQTEILESLTVTCDNEPPEITISQPSATSFLSFYHHWQPPFRKTPKLEEEKKEAKCYEYTSSESKEITRYTKTRSTQIEGKTETDADLLIDNKPVKVNPDGTFKITKYISGEQLVVNIKATDKAENTTKVKLILHYIASIPYSYTGEDEVYDKAYDIGYEDGQELEYGRQYDNIYSGSQASDYDDGYYDGFIAGCEDWTEEDCESYVE